MIEIKGLTREYVVNEKETGFFMKGKRKKIVALNELSLVANEGDAIGILGANGAGKSTLIKLLSGIISPTKGEILIDSKYIPFEKKREYLKKMTLVSGNKTQLNFDLSPRDNFYFLGALYGISKQQVDAMSNDLCSRLGCDKLKDRQVRKLSFGERLKMEIVAALIHNPKYVYLDEPTIGLDIRSQVQLREFIRTYCQKDKIVFLTSHNLDDISEVCNKLLFIESGYPVCFEDINQFCKHYYTARHVKVTVGVEALGQIRSFLNRESVLNLKTFGNEISFDVENNRYLYTLRVLLDEFEEKILEINTDDTGVSNILKKRILND